MKAETIIVTEEWRPVISKRDWIQTICITIFNAWAYMLKIELKENAVLTNEILRVGASLYNSLFSETYQCNKWIFPRFGLATEEYFVDWRIQRHTTFVNDHKLNWFAATDHQRKASRAQQTQHVNSSDCQDEPFCTWQIVNVVRR